MYKQASIGWLWHQLWLLNVRDWYPSFSSTNSFSINLILFFPFQSLFMESGGNIKVNQSSHFCLFCWVLLNWQFIKPGKQNWRGKIQMCFCALNVWFGTSKNGAGLSFEPGYCGWSVVHWWGFEFLFVMESVSKSVKYLHLLFAYMYYSVVVFDMNRHPCLYCFCWIYFCCKIVWICFYGVCFFWCVLILL